ncbi:MAG TPA: DUF1501 domain-containing protein [Candidatus Saccharimonadales bacterium]|nr:DUF1501 domain-containing protein [Candidatus Saccharimonadales bacterium]
MITRRDFMVSGITAAGVGIIVPPVFAKSVFAATAEHIHNDRVLVILQLGGGNDGLNTVIPYADPAYLQSRPTIGIPASNVLPLNAEVGLNPVMPSIKALYEAGEVAIVQGVGYANPVYSHFEGLYIWEHADPSMQQTEGWLGTLLASQLDGQGHPLTGCALGQVSAPAELLAQNATVSVIESIPTYQVLGGAGRKVAAPALYRTTPGVYGMLFDEALSTAEHGIAALAGSQSRYTPAVSYTPTNTAHGSKTSLAASLQLTAEMIVTQPSVKICHVVLDGFDTHQDETTRQNALLSSVDSAVSAFMQDIAAHGMADRVVLMTWSEFGRRVVENGGNGTDHGAAAPIFVVGKPVHGGILGEQPSLTATVDSGNLKYTVDFRSVYQTLIRDWLQADPTSVLGASFPELPLIRTA